MHHPSSRCFLLWNQVDNRFRLTFPIAGMNPAVKIKTILTAGAYTSLDKGSVSFYIGKYKAIAFPLWPG